MTMLAYVDNIFILGNSLRELIYKAKKSIAFSRNMGFMINKTKTKYMDNVTDG